MSALKVFGREKFNLIRESQSGLNIFMYFLSKDLVSFIIMILNSLFFTLSFYFILSPRESFYFYFLVMLLLSFTTFPIGYSISILLNQEIAQVTSVVFIFIVYLLAGVTPSLPKILSRILPFPILPYLSHLRYLREIVYMYELNTYREEYQIEKSLNLNGYIWDNRFINLVAIIEFGIILRIISFFILWQYKPNSYLKCTIFFIRFKIGLLRYKFDEFYNKYFKIFFDYCTGKKRLDDNW
jgi:hypothetical protein